jgi:glutamate--cysteine ligase
MSTAPNHGPSDEVTSIAQCVAWIARGATPAPQRALGVEYECLVVGADGRTVPYEGANGIRALLEALCTHQGWTPVFEGDQPIALTREGTSISLESAGQLEFSGAPLPTVDAVEAELTRYLRELGEVAAPLGLRFAWVGYHPDEARVPSTRVPRERFALMRTLMPEVGSTGIAMLDFTCAEQVNLDFTDAADCIEGIRLGHLLTPVLIALFANSPVARGTNAGFRSWRAQIWPEVDRARCGAPPCVFDANLSLEDLVTWAWSVPMYFLAHRRQDGGIGYLRLDRPLTFGQYVSDGYHDRRATMHDWELHVSTLYADVRLRQHLELRQCDTVPPDALLALPALAKGLFYDNEARRQAIELLTQGIRPTDRARLRNEAAREALDARLGRQSLREIARELIRIARRGNAAQQALTGPDAAASYGLDPLEAIVTGERPSFWQDVQARWNRGNGLMGLTYPDPDFALKGARAATADLRR